MQITQDGDKEGVATFDPEKLEQARLAMKYAKVKGRRKVSEEEWRRLKQIEFKKRVSEALLVSESISTPTVESEKTLYKPRSRAEERIRRIKAQRAFLRPPDSDQPGAA